MSKYSKYKAEALRLLKTGLSTEKIARQINKGDNVASLARYVRTWRQEPMKVPKIVLFDIETAPIKTYTWSKWQTPISDNQIIEDWFIISWSAKELFSKSIYHAVLTPDEIKNCDDERITNSLWKVFDEADILIAHNLKKFDKKKANTRFLKYRLNMPSHYREVDTLIEARRNFAITSNRLDYLAQFLGVEGKLDTPKGLWNDCLKGDQHALKEMVRYCNQDVKVLEDVYLELRPWMTSHPNINLFTGSEDVRCKACGSESLEPAGYYTTNSHVYEGFRCKDCGSMHRAKKNCTKNSKSLLR